MWLHDLLELILVWSCPEWLPDILLQAMKQLLAVIHKEEEVQSPLVHFEAALQA